MRQDSPIQQLRDQEHDATVELLRLRDELNEARAALDEAHAAGREAQDLIRRALAAKNAAEVEFREFVGLDQ